MYCNVMATSTTKLTHSIRIRLARLVWFALASLKMRLASLGAVREIRLLRWGGGQGG